MVLAVQTAGVLFVLMMLYLTFLFYRKKDYSQKEFLLWVLIWACALALLILPAQVVSIMESLDFARTTDLYLSIGLMFVIAIAFLDHVKVKRQERKVEELVRKVAISLPRKNK